LKCTSAYPAPPDAMNLRTMQDMRERFHVEIGLSDHSLGIAVPIAAASLGAVIIEKHFALSRNDPGPDSAFSLEPDELKQMIDCVRIAEQSLGKACYGPSEADRGNLSFRRSLYAVRDIPANAVIAEQDVRAIRPGFGLHTRHLSEVIGARAKCVITRGTPLSWECLDTDKTSVIHD
jgi:pseudaminic acid synthase